MRVYNGSIENVLRLHKDLGMSDYRVVILRKWRDGKYTVLFLKNEQDSVYGPEGAVG